jgi:dephospho-CoA kinase
MFKIGLTGGIGSGKSVAASLLQVMGVPVFIADEESKKLTDTSPVIREQLTALLGGEEIYSGGKLDRKRLASRIFTHPQCLQQVNAVIHPAVNRRFLQWAAEQTTPLCAIETAILFESGFHRAVNFSVMVYAPQELRIARAVARGGMTREDVMRRISNQMPDEEKKNLSDYVIDNGGRRALIPQLAAILAAIKAKAS